MVARRLALVMLVLAGILAVAAPPADASHYALTQAGFVSAAERKALQRAGIFDTAVLLDWAAKRAGRRWLSGETRIAEARLLALARRCDLLRVTGIGPNILEVLVKADIQDTRDLAHAVAEPLLSRMRKVARGTAMATRLPAEDTLTAWITEALRLRPLLD